MQRRATDAPAHDSPLARAVADYCRQGYTPPSKQTRAAFRTDPVWQALTEVGTALWLDTGDADAAAKLWTQEFVALTTNNTLLNKEVQKGIYDDVVPKVAKIVREQRTGISDALLVQEIAFALNAVHGLMLVQKFDADVSVELHTNLAWDTDASYRYGKRFAAIEPNRFIVKVPLTPEGVFAARKLRNDGIRVNFTLGFSARENGLIATVARPNWVNVFMGRCNAFVADNGLGSGDDVGEKATLASQRLMREVSKEIGAEVRQIGASMRNGQQAIDLQGLDVYTMPTKVAQEYHDAAPTGDQVRDRTQNDPKVTLSGGRTPESEHLDVLWRTDDTMAKAMAALRKESLDAMDSDGLRTFLRDHGVGDLFPELSDDDRARIHKDGKIPKYAAWADRVKKGELAWDALLTESAIASFATDQAALDERIREHL